MGAMITNEVREEAIEICATMASSSTQRHLLIEGTEEIETPTAPAWDLGEACAIDESPVHRLVSHVFMVVAMYRNLYSTTREMWAEAEALLITGFDPETDDVVQLESHPDCRCLPDVKFTVTVQGEVHSHVDVVKIDYVPSGLTANDVDRVFTEPCDIEGLL
jgi:hypothetical protein